MDKRKASECEHGDLISSEADGLACGSPAKAAKPTPKSRAHQTPASPGDTNHPRREPNSHKNHDTQQGLHDAVPPADDHDGNSDGILDGSYLPNTKIPTAGWFQPCRSCRKWTAATLTINAVEVSICKQCQLDSVRQHYLAKQGDPRVARNLPVKVKHAAAIESASLEAGVDAGHFFTSSVESSPGQYIPPSFEAGVSAGKPAPAEL